MVLYRRHLEAASGEPSDFAKASRSVAQKHLFRLRKRQGPQSPPQDSSTPDTSSPRLSTSSRPVPKSIPKLRSAYDVTLFVRSKNPVADAHDPNIGSEDLPSHHVPTFVSVAHRAIQRQGTSRSARSRRRATQAARRAAEALKTSSAIPSGPASQWRPGGSKRFAHPAAAQEHHSRTSSFPLLGFQNPWDSFKPPTLLNVWQGLKWGLPEDYDEGGHSRYRGQGRRAAKAAQEYRAAEAELGKKWAAIDIRQPNWGWSEQEDMPRRLTSGEQEGPQQRPKSPLSNTDTETKPSSSTTLTASASPGPSAQGKYQEWQDPRAEEPADHARVSWLGHATVLLQLPPLADPLAKREHIAEETPGRSFGSLSDSPPRTRKGKELLGEVTPPRRRAVSESKPKPKKLIIQHGKGKNATTDEVIGGQVTSDISSDVLSESDDEEPEEPTPAPSHPPSTTASPTPPSTRSELDNDCDRSINILFDPIFSRRCSPSKNVGPQRFTEAPCSAEELPPIDVILISHDHYDHADVDSLRRILKRRGQAVHVFAALGNKDWLCSSVGFKKSQVSELDWWDEAVLTATAGSSLAEKLAHTQSDSTENLQAAVRIICTPAQHGSGRVPGGKDSTLWCSWVVESITPATAVASKAQNAQVQKRAEQQRRRWRVFFAGDTGLRRHGEKPTGRRAPVCPAFEEIARRYGTPHLSLLPISIGSSLSYLRSKDPFPRRYSPFPRVSEALTSCIHMDAEDAVTVMDIMRGWKEGGKGRVSAEEKDGAEVAQPLALAIHFGTFVRNVEQTKMDVRNLRSACLRHGIEFGRTRDGRFQAADQPRGQQRNGKFLVSGASRMWH